MQASRNTLQRTRATGAAEIDDHYRVDVAPLSAGVARLSEHQILRLQVAVGIASCVQRGQRRHDPTHEKPDLPSRPAAAVGTGTDEALLYGSAFAEPAHTEGGR